MFYYPGLCTLHGYDARMSNTRSTDGSPGSVRTLGAHQRGHGIGTYRQQLPSKMPWFPSERNHTHQRLLPEQSFRVTHLKACSLNTRNTWISNPTCLLLCLPETDANVQSRSSLHASPQVCVREISVCKTQAGAGHGFKDEKYIISLPGNGV